MCGAGELEGLNAALRRGEEDLRYPLGPPQPLTDLAQDFAYSANHRRKIAELARCGYGHVRRVRGDGNCFYRAVGFAWLEALGALAAGSACAGVALADALPCGWPDEAGFGSLAAEYKELRQEVRRMLGASAAGAGTGASRPLLQRLLCDVRFDLCLVVLVRRIVAGFLERGAHGGASTDDTAGAILEAVSAEFGSPTNLAVAQVLPLGQEAEGATIAVAARELGARLRIVQLDGSSGPMPTYVYPSEDYSSRLGVRICLLFRPGHYEVLYRDDAPRFQEPPLIPGICSFCRDTSSLQGDGLLTCFHRLCAACTSQSCRRETHLQCPICSEAPPFCTDTRTAWQPQTTVDLPKGTARSRGPVTTLDLGRAAESLDAAQRPPSRLLHSPAAQGTAPLRTQLDLAAGRSTLPQTQADAAPSRSPAGGHGEFLRSTLEAHQPFDRWPQPAAQGAAVPQTHLDAMAGWSPTGGYQELQRPARSEAYLSRQRPLGGAEAAASPAATASPASAASASNRLAAALGGEGGHVSGDRGQTAGPVLQIPGTSMALQPDARAAPGLRIPGTSADLTPILRAAQDRPSAAGTAPFFPGGSAQGSRAPRTSLPVSSVSGSRASSSASPSASQAASASPGASPLGLSLSGFSTFAALGQGSPSGQQTVPQTESNLTAVYSPAVARCVRCTARDNLRRVRCCGVYFCHGCLAEMISGSRAGSSLRCLSCRALWDMEQLSRAWLASAPGGISSQHVAAGLRQGGTGVALPAEGVQCSGPGPASG
mmetsp:Transcript_92961/g.277451  ORF Transcript_92961/g.277451 Transcript_92961/m.277451 type:complete len:769 (-) Transcript_92961:26-2332(-)